MLQGVGKILKNVFSTFVQPETKATCRTVLPEFSCTKLLRTLIPHSHHLPDRFHRVKEALPGSSILLALEASECLTVLLEKYVADDVASLNLTCFTVIG